MAMDEKEFVRGLLSRPPSFSNEEVEECRRTDGHISMLFEWYQYVGLLAHEIASI
jgi:hypothetical protein